MAGVIDSIHDRAMVDLAAFITDLGLPTSPTVAPVAPTVYTQMLPDETNIVLPAILVTCEGISEEEGDRSSFEQDHVIYPVAVAILDRVSVRYQEMRPIYLSWRRTMMRALRGLVNMPLLENTPEVTDIRLRPGVIFDPETREYQLLQSGFTVLCHSFEDRERNTSS